jgi:uncharacterized protein (DUF4213/DUF364 family)
MDIFAGMPSFLTPKLYLAAWKILKVRRSIRYGDNFHVRDTLTNLLQLTQYSGSLDPVEQAISDAVINAISDSLNERERISAALTAIVMIEEKSNRVIYKAILGLVGFTALIGTFFALLAKGKFSVFTNNNVINNNPSFLSHSNNNNNNTQDINVFSKLLNYVWSWGGK